jgi:hypothetical protein
LRLSAILLLLLGASCGDGGDTCSQPIASATGGAAGSVYLQCRDASGCYWLASDGSRFRCNSCDDCSAALAAAEHGRLGEPASGGERPGETCGLTLHCPNGSARFYQVCTSSDRTACRALTDDGTSFDCVSCADCKSSAVQVHAWCASAH